MDKITLSVTATAAALGVSRPTVYQLIKRSDFPVLRVGGRTLISADGLRSWVEAQAERGDTAARVRPSHRRSRIRNQPPRTGCPDRPVRQAVTLLDIT